MPYTRQNKEVFPFIVVLKRRYKRAFTLLSLFMTLFYAVYLLRTILVSEDLTGRILTGLLLVAVTGLLYAEFRQYQRKKYGSSFYLVGILAFFSLPFPIGLVYALLTWITHLASRPEEIGFSEDRILVRKGFTKTIHWDELNNVLIKDGILTMDFKNNKLFQSETEDEEDEEEYNGTEEEFNAYCKARLGN
jgi:hypothetical protein